MFSPRACPLRILTSYNSGDYSDLTITCGPMVFGVHRVVVCTGCAFFQKSAKFGKEAEEKCINLPEDEPEMIRRLIAYLYLGDYEPCHQDNIFSFQNMKLPESNTKAAAIYHARYSRALFDTDRCACLAHVPFKAVQKSEPRSSTIPQDYKFIEKPEKSVEVLAPLSIHAAMYALGDKYLVDGLCQLAISKFESCLQYHWDSEDFIDAVQIVYSSTPESNRGLRDVVLKAFAVHFKIDVTQIPSFEAKLHTIDELAFQLMKSWPKSADCGSQSAQKNPNVASAPPFFGATPSAFTGRVQPTPLFIMSSGNPTRPPGFGGQRS